MRTAELGPSRRTFLKLLAATLAAFLTAAAGVPIVGAVVAPGLRRDEARWVPVGAISDFAIGQPRMVSFTVVKTDGYARSTTTRAVWVCRQADDQMLVYNARCTHLGCLVGYRADSQTFLCPCHGGVFALIDGRVVDGPPPRPLDRLDYRVENGQLLVQYRDFLVGVPEQVAL